jgi:hypothetical protein
MRLRERVLITIVLAALSAGALWIDRSIQFFIGRDSSLFLYVAQRIQDGGLPYRDVWDHKPPLIYYFGVIGLATRRSTFRRSIARAREGWTPLEPKYAILPEMDRLFSWIETNYVRVDDVGYLRWPIYAPRNAVTPQ